MCIPTNMSVGHWPVLVPKLVLKVAHQARPKNRAMPERTSLCVLQFRSFFRLVKQLGPQNEKLVTESRRFVL